MWIPHARSLPLIAAALPESFSGQPSPVVFSYLRFSNPSQATGDSIRRQTRRTDKWSERTGIPIDESLTLRDSGVSAFRGKNATQGAMAEFLAMVDAGRVWPGCYLSIENLDRLSRQEPLESVTLMQRILRAGVRIVVHTPMESVYDENSASQTHTLFLIISEFIRAHEESKRKSNLLSESWKGKRQRLMKNDIKLTARSPWWLEPIRNADKRITGYRAIPDHVEIVKQIVKLCIDGHGNTSICRILNDTGVPTIGKSDRWAQSTVQKLLNDRSLIGEYQPHKMVDGKRTPIGDAIAGYFPAVIAEDTFYKMQSAIVDRALPRGKYAEQVRNLFTGLLFDARDGASMDIIDKGRKSSGPAIVNSDARLGKKGAAYLSFPAEEFEKTFLSLITEIDLRLVMPRKVSGLAKQIAAAAGEVDAIEGRVIAIKAKIKTNKKGISAMLDLLAESTEELDRAKDKLEHLRRQQATPSTHALKTAKDLVDKLSSAEPAERVELRTKMRSVVRQFVKQITVLIAEVNRDRVLMADIMLTSGQRRKLVIETGTPAPDELYKLDVRNFDQWPDEFKVTRFKAMPEIDRQILELDDKGTLIQYIAETVGVSQTKVSRTLTKHGRRRVANRKPHDSDVLMTWNDSSNGWQKTKNKQRYYIGCGDLKKLYPRQVKTLDRAGTLKAANRWWTERLKEIESSSAKKRG